MWSVSVVELLADCDIAILFRPPSASIVRLAAVSTTGERRLGTMSILVVALVPDDQDALKA